MSVVGTFVRSVALAGVVAMAVVAAPAATAHETVCSGRWLMSTPDMYALSLVPSSGTFVADYTLGGCLPDLRRPNISGRVSGFCYQMAGSGTFDGHSFAFTTAGTAMVFTGAVSGTLTITPAVGESCISGADTWDLTGTLVLAHVL